MLVDDAALVPGGTVMSGDSKNSEMSLERVLALMDKWRHLPAYQLERRADVLFGLFLPDVLGTHFGIKVNPILIPEFPIKKEGDNQSKKVDYFGLQESARVRRAFLIELKTDMASRREEQDDYLRQAVSDGLKKVILGIIEICRATDERKKYVHLLKLLSCVKLIEYEDTLFPPTQPGFGGALDVIQKKVAKTGTRDWPSLEVVYVQPRMPPNVIDFSKFAEVAEEGGSDIGRTFACYLREWTKDAGDRDPNCPGPC